MTHDEVFSIADYLTLRHARRSTTGRPCMFVYHPCDDAMLSTLELEGRGWTPQPTRRIIRAEIVTGMDELGVLIAGHAKNAYWFGSQLSIAEARRHVPYTQCDLPAGRRRRAGRDDLRRSAIPERGCAKPDQLDFRAVLENRAALYLGSLVGAYTDWTPLQGRGELFSGGPGSRPALVAAKRLRPPVALMRSPMKPCMAWCAVLCLVATRPLQATTSRSAPDHARGPLAHEAGRTAGALAGRQARRRVRRRSPPTTTARNRATSGSFRRTAAHRRARLTFSNGAGIGRDLERGLAPPRGSRPSAKARTSRRSTCSTSTRRQRRPNA